MASLLAVLEDKRQKLEDERSELIQKAEVTKDFGTLVADGSEKTIRERVAEIDGELPDVVRDRDLAAAERKRIVTAAVAYTEGDSSGELKEGLMTALGQGRQMIALPSQQFLGATEWNDYLAKIAPGGRQITDSVAIESPKIPIEGSSLTWLRKGAEVITGGSSTSQGALMVNDRLPIVDAFYQRPITLLDLFATGTTDADVVEYVRLTSYTNGAASVPEATHIDGTDESPSMASHKPWAQMALAKITEAVVTIAVGIPATRRALTNPGQMRQLIDDALRYDLKLEVERQAVEGTGSGDEEFEGFATVSNTQDQAFDTNIVLTLRKAITKVRINGRTTANGIAMNPTDVDDLYAEALTSEAPGMAAILLQLANGTLHGKPIVESEAIDAGSAWAADFKKAFLLDREQATIQATSGYMDFFMRNLVAILGEQRAVFGVVRPKAFCQVDLGS
jgi:HK97 family phage major capsid protein